MSTTSTRTPEPEIQPGHPFRHAGHAFKKVAGVWTCPCGELRDKHGKPPKVRHLQLVR